MTYNYKYWTAFREADLLKSGDGNLNKGDSFVMPGAATVTLAAYDDDSQLSGDRHTNETSDDSAQNGWYHDGTSWVNTHSSFYVELLWTLTGSDGKTYYLAEIEGDNGFNAPGTGDDFFSFVGDTPPAGVTLTLTSCTNSSGVNYADLSAEPSAAATNHAPEFDNLPTNGVLHIDENETAVIDINASDSDGDTLSYEIVGGRDAAFFEIDAHTGELSFKSAPDFENPQSGGGSNTYDVTVKVSDGNGGSETKALWVKVQDVDESTGGEPECVVIEAEDMHEAGFHIAHGSQASGGEFLKLNSAGGNGDIWTTFNGEGGTYDFTLRAQDESDGQSTIMVKVNGHVVGTIKLDGDNNGGGSDNGGFSNFTLEGIEINNGDQISLWVDGDRGEFARIDNLTFKEVESAPEFRECDDPNAVNIDFEGLAKGTVVGTQYDGVMISAQKTGDGGPSSGSPNDAMVFDGANPTGGDTDLTASGDNVLIVSEDNDSSDPDDNAGGGTIWFKFDEPSYIYDIKVLDAEEGGKIRLLDENGALIEEIAIPGGTDGGIQQILIDVDGVAQIDLTLNGSGAIDDLCYVPGEPAPLGSIAGTYFMDNNDNDVQDAADMGLANQTVWLLEVGVGVVGTTTTDADGNYIFNDLEAGDYFVRFDGNNVDGKTIVESNVGTDDTIDSDIDNTGTAGNHNTGVISLGEGENVTDVDAGVEDPGTASLGGRYFMDNNDNDIQDADDMAVANATVRLFDGGTLVRETTTDANGDYLFENLKANDDYIVKFVDTEEGKTFVNGDVGGDDTIDSDVTSVGGGGNGMTDAISLSIGEDKRDVDGGIEDPGTASLAGKVFMDNNDNSVDDTGDMPVAGVTVTLSNGQTAVTDANGEYEFTGLAAGDYTVTFPTTFDGKTLVQSNVGGDDTIDSDADEGTGSTGTITLGIGERSEDNDAGLEIVDTGDAVIKGRVFMDNDGSNTDTAGDMGVAGVTVTLSNGDTAVTDADGNYEFTGLPAGDYVVTFPTSVDGKVLVDSNVGGDDTIDSDADEGTGSTGTITVGIGEVSENNDAGVEDPGTASLAGRVFMDNNDNSLDDGEMGVRLVTVALFTAAGDLVATTETAADGSYEFTGLAAGTYFVDFDEGDADLGGKVLVTQDVDGNVSDTIDSDADEGNGTTDDIVLGIGERIEDIDAGVEAVNAAPTATDDAATTCADDEVTVDVLVNDADADGDAITIIAVDGQAISEGETITTGEGTLVTLVNGELVVDGEDAYAALDIGEEAVETISYTVSDGNGGTADASLDVTFCGDANSAASLAAAIDGSVATFELQPVDVAGFIDAYTLDLISSDVNGLGAATFTAAYCLDGLQPIDQGILTTADVYVANEANAALVSSNINVDKIDSVNWLLNNDFTQVDNGDGTGDTYTDLEVQEAVWLLMNEDTFVINEFANPEFTDNGNGVRDGAELGTLENAMEIAMTAMTAGDGFEAGDGDIIGLILDPTDPATQEQPFIIGVSFDSIDCLC